MTVRRLLTTMGLLALALSLAAFQGEPEAPAANEGIPWLVWLLLLLVAFGLFWLAWSRRDVDAFAGEPHDDHAAHGIEDDGHAHAPGDLGPQGRQVRHEHQRRHGQPQQDRKSVV